MKAPEKKKPDYKKFIKRPAPLSFSPSEGSYASSSSVRKVTVLKEEDIPWAEIIFDSVEAPLISNVRNTAPIPRILHQEPPIALMAIALLGMILLLCWNS
ncbi:hypothetical protein Desti_2383 [Desulfomonile tiedjei DSM 6799]|uniref:Uncharacterized protein n=1 Tax=Desulfomonile tiedjei (strain ATCC 49306 / DSM 6799 / DCB-1) TaxID=706587 RepID=I4C676_DESTA|nr:hypothetical protein Desti_2383 [Desulfomonile tiedjei DSM 6799]